MSAPKTQPPWDFLLSASRTSLQSFELSRLSHAANLRKEIAALLDQWIDESSEALLARWLMEQDERSGHVQQPVTPKPPVPENRAGASHNFFANQTVSPFVHRGPS